MQKINYAHVVKRLLHWVIASLIISGYLLGLIMNHITGHKNFYMYDIHLQTGLLVLLLVVMRILWKYGTLYKKTITRLKLAQGRATEYLYILLYTLMLVIAISGTVFVQAKGRQLSIFGLFDLPTLIEVKPKVFTQFIFKWHKWLSHIIVIFACLHIINILRYKIVKMIVKIINKHR